MRCVLRIVTVYCNSCYELCEMLLLIVTMCCYCVLRVLYTCISFRAFLLLFINYLLCIADVYYCIVIQFLLLCILCIVFVLQTACFQLVLASDYRFYKSFVLFNYHSLRWQIYRPSSQGWQSMQGRSYSLFTSGTPLAYQLPNLVGNRGRRHA